MVQADLQDEGNEVKTHCKLFFSRLPHLAAGAVWLEWDPGENLVGGGFSWFWQSYLNFCGGKVKISQQSVLRGFITAGLYTSAFYSVLRTVCRDVLLRSCQTLIMTGNGLFLYLIAHIGKKHPSKMEICWV